MNVVALHGFLGKPSDWDFIHPDHAPALDQQPLLPLCQWAQGFNQEVQSPSLLIGYSLGGRLALHCCLDNPHQWRGAVIVSAHTGLPSKEERQQRRENDEQWAARFEKEEWVPLMDAWNAQPVLQSSQQLPRLEQHYQRHKLAAMLRVWSLANQNDLTQDIQSLPIPILWIVGAKDEKYMERASHLSFAHPQSEVVVVPDAGHRVPWDSSTTFIKLIESFRSRL